MKKLRIFSLFLAAALTVQAAVLPVFAEPEESTADTSASIQTTQPQNDRVISVPSDFTGDASVTYGCKTLDAAYALAQPEDHQVGAKSAIAYDLNSDTLLFAQNADERLYPASMTKIMTALLILENVTDLEEVVTVEWSMVDGLDPTGSNVALWGGEQLPVRDLLYCLMIPSANDAAMVLATHVSGSVDAFVEMMNQRAAELGCTNTHFMNPHGLHDDDHYTSARDMAKIMEAALEQPLFCEMFSTLNYTVAATNKTEERVLNSTNRILIDSGYPRVYDSRVIGGKTGYTSKAGRCLVALSEDSGMKLITVVMGAKSTYSSDGTYITRYGSFEETSALLDFAYDNFTGLQVLTQDQVLSGFDVENGDTDVYSHVLEPVVAVVPNGSGYESVRYEYTLAGQTLSAPIESGAAIGAVRVWVDGLCVTQKTMYASNAVAKAVPRVSSGDTGSETDLNGVIQNVLIVVVVILVVVILLMVLANIRRNARRARRRRRSSAHRTGGTQSRTGRNGNGRSGTRQSTGGRRR